MRSELGIGFSQQVEIDASLDIARVWEASTPEKIRKCPISPFGTWTPSNLIRIVGQVADPTLLNLSQFHVNLVHTMSPPCTSWSKGGRRQGLATDNGIAFVDALVFAHSSQAILIAAECADDIITHDHFQIVMFVAKMLGYRRVWTQITPLRTAVQDGYVFGSGLMSRPSLSISPSSLRFSPNLVGPIRFITLTYQGHGWTRCS